MENRVQLIGNLGTQPEAKTINDAMKVHFSMATNQVYKDKEGNKKTLTDWHNVVAWGPLAATIDQFISKGDKIAITGKLVSRSYEDAEGQRKYVTEVVASEMLMLNTKTEPSKA